MANSWPEIREFYPRFPEGKGSDAFLDAVGGIASLARYIADGPLAARIYGFTSMQALCIHQTPQNPFSTFHLIPHLRITPLPTGLVEFRYIDTYREARQWVRVEAPEATIARFDRFLERLHWLIEERSAS